MLDNQFMPYDESALNFIADFLMSDVQKSKV